MLEIGEIIAGILHNLCLIFVKGKSDPTETLVSVISATFRFKFVKIRAQDPSEKMTTCLKNSEVY